jgi:hypothetical protein
MKKSKQVIYIFILLNTIFLMYESFRFFILNLPMNSLIFISFSFFIEILFGLYTLISLSDKEII